MPEPSVPTPAPESAADLDPIPDLALLPPAPELPDELRPLHEEYGLRWRIGYEPLCRAAPYTARPRFGDGRTVRTDTPRLLGRVLAAATSDEGGAPDLGE